MRFRLQPVEKDLNRLPDAADARGHSVLGHQSVVFLPLPRRNERDVSLALQLDTVIPQVFRRIPRQIAEIRCCFGGI